jgi:DNA excision repair protein ERCC-2
VEYSLRSGDLELDSFGFSKGAIEGILAHQKIRSTRPKEYQAEVSISLEKETTNYNVTVNGRIDGIYQYKDKVIIDEIKSTSQNLESIQPSDYPLHWAQAKVYAYIFSRQNNLKSINVQLTYFHIDTSQVREFLKSYTLSELEEFFDGLLYIYLEWVKILDKWSQQRDHSIQHLEFPYKDFRLGQRKMIDNITHTIEENSQLIMEAPTGTGKTMAAIFPAVKCVGKGFIEKFFFLTAKTTGRIVAQDALDDLRDHGLKFKSITITAKEKICFNPIHSCTAEECKFARGYFDRINEATKRIFQQEDALTRERIESEARAFNICPFEFSLELSLWVDCIVCDYNYAFDPRVYLRRFFMEDDGKTPFAFLVDEANNLVDRSREMFSAQLWKQSFLDLRKGIKNYLPQVSKGLGKINSQLVRLKKETEEAEKPLAHETYPEDLPSKLRGLVRSMERWLVLNIKTPFRKNVLDLYFEVSWFLKVVENYDSSYAFCVEKVSKDLKIKLFCMDPSTQLGEALDRSRSVIFFSATLTPVDYFRSIFGCKSSCQEVKLPSPFPPQNLSLNIAYRISTLYKYRENTKGKVVDILQSMIYQQKGNYLVFFPSYEYMKKIYDLFPKNSNAFQILIQNPGMTEIEREDFLKRFSHNNRSRGITLVGFAVMGGVFGEGIDLAGDRLTGAAIVGVGLPGISLERELIKNYYHGLKGMGFEYAYLYPGIIRVFQASGRVIRSATDRGVVLLIGSRFSTNRYRALFPEYWQPNLIQDQIQLEQVLNQFYHSRHEKENTFR